MLLKSLADAELGNGKEVLVWFPDKKLLAFGTEPKRSSPISRR